jgi:hypothetical protein
MITMNDKIIDQSIKTATQASLLPSKRISAELMGDNAVMASVLETSLQITGSKFSKDAVMISLAIKALSKVVDDCSVGTGKRFPNVADVEEFLASNMNR